METIKAIILACQLNGGTNSHIQARLQQECQIELTKCFLKAPGDSDALALIQCMGRKPNDK